MYKVTVLMCLYNLLLHFYICTVYFFFSVETEINESSVAVFRHLLTHSSSSLPVDAGGHNKSDKQRERSRFVSTRNIYNDFMLQLNKITFVYN